MPQDFTSQELSAGGNTFTSGYTSGTVCPRTGTYKAENQYMQTIVVVVKGNNVTVAGQLKGNIEASGETSIRETGLVDGDITSAGLAISSGGQFSGRSRMHKDSKEA